MICSVNYCVYFFLIGVTRRGVKILILSYYNSCGYYTFCTIAFRSPIFVRVRCYELLLLPTIIINCTMWVQHHISVKFFFLHITIIIIYKSSSTNSNFIMFQKSSVRNLNLNIQYYFFFTGFHKTRFWDNGIDSQIGIGITLKTICKFTPLGSSTGHELHASKNILLLYNIIMQTCQKRTRNTNFINFEFFSNSYIIVLTRRE